MQGNYNGLYHLGKYISDLTARYASQAGHKSQRKSFLAGVQELKVPHRQTKRPGGFKCERASPETCIFLGACEMVILQILVPLAPRSLKSIQVKLLIK